MARTGGPGARGVSAFLVPTDRPGFTANKLHGKLGLRSCDTAELVLDGVEVGPEALLGGEGNGIKVALSALDDGRMSIAASCTGIGAGRPGRHGRLHEQREQFGKPIAGHQLVQELIADTAVDVDAARLLTWAVADLKARGEDYSLAASKAKLFATEASVRAANTCIQVHGGYGYVDEYPAGKYLRDARVTTLYEGTSEIQKLIIGRALTGFTPSDGRPAQLSAGPRTVGREAAGVSARYSPAAGVTVITGGARVEPRTMDGHAVVHAATARSPSASWHRGRCRRIVALRRARTAATSRSSWRSSSSTRCSWSPCRCSSRRSSTTASTARATAASSSTCRLVIAGLARRRRAADAGPALVSARIGEGLIYDLRTQVFAHVQRMPIAFFTRTQTGALVSRLNNDVIGAQQAFTVDAVVGRVAT